MGAEEHSMGFLTSSEMEFDFSSYGPPEISASEGESHPGETEVIMNYPLETLHDILFLWLMGKKDWPEVFHFSIWSALP